MFRHRLKEARQRARMTQEQLATSIGVAKSTLAGYETGNSEPDMEKMERIMAVLKVDANFLLQDEMEKSGGFNFNLSFAELQLIEQYRSMDDAGRELIDYVLAYAASRTTQEEDNICAEPESVRTNPARNAMVEYRRYTSPAAAGTPLWAESEYETLTCAADDVPDDADYAVGIKGESMEPDIPDGSTVWVKRSYTVDDGDIVIAWIDGEGTVCKQARCKGDKIICLHSLNPAYPDITGQELSELRIYGIVVGKMN